jgi:hypothetical protein
MAKELEKLTKEFAPLKKQAETLLDSTAPLGTNFRHHESMNYEASDEITRRVGELKKEGKTGTTLKEFAGDSEIKAILAEVENNKKKLTTIISKYNQVETDAKKTHAALTKMKEGLDKEIASRQKKKDRKVFAVDSASLPDMEKLSTEIGDVAKSLYDEIIAFLQTTPMVYDPDKTDKLIEKAVTASPEARGQRDDKELAKRGLDLRILGRNTKLAQSSREEVKKWLLETVKEFKGGNKGKAQDNLAKAVEARGQLQKTAEQYELAMKGLNKYDLQSMQESKDGKAIIAATGLIAKLDEEAGKELDLIVSKIKF